MRITANHVTLARIFLLPVPVYMLIYGEVYQWWIAFAVFVILGATDFVDGLMARKEGPTKLGSLIDPVADKIFVAAIMLSMMALELFPPWMICTLLTREFLMTALRSSVASRKESLKTSRLAKLKTIIQMGGCGTIFFAIALSEKAFIITCLALSIPFLAVAVVYWCLSKKPPFWALPVGLAFDFVAMVEYFFAKDVTLMVQMLIILVITWASAVDYVMNSFRLFRKTGMVLGDWIRMLWSIMYGLVISLLVAYIPIMVLPVLVSLSLEFGLGGIDNIVVSEKHRFSSWPFLLSTLAGGIFVLLILLTLNGQFDHPFYCALGLAMASSLICGAFFGRHVDIFLKPKTT